MTTRETDGTCAEQCLDGQQAFWSGKAFYPKWVEANRMRKDTADRHLASMQAALDTLKWLEPRMGWIKEEAERRDKAQRALDDMNNNPTVAALVSQWPEATPTDVRELEEAEA